MKRSPETSSIRRKKAGTIQQNENNLEKPDDLSSETRAEPQQQSPNLKGDYGNIALLLLLYLLQGIPLGLIAGIPLILINHGITYKDQAIFSLVIWPFSFKLLWAPIVDAVYWPKLGRRKSWLIPAQYLIGIFMIAISFRLDHLLHQETLNIYTLTGMFFILNFLAATQDIAVDGWALTMLKPRNIGYASTCNSVGQTAGYFFGYVVFLILESARFANYFRSEPKDHGFIDMKGFFFFWGIVFIVVTSFVMFFKSEEDVQTVPKRKERQQNIHEPRTILGTYSLLIKILKLGPVQSLAIILLTCKIGFAVTDAATGLKLKEAGLPLDHIAMMAVPMIPLQIILPWVIGRYTTGPRPLDVFLWAYPYRLMFCYVFIALLLWTNYIKSTLDYFPIYYYVILLICYGLHQITLYSMFVAMMAFYAKISDPLIGGTYMTLLNTINNLGGNWPSTLALWILDWITLSYCSEDGNRCWKNKKDEDDDDCDLDGGVCETWVDGYHIETVILTIFGFAWFYFWAKKRINQLQTLPLSAWRCAASS